jgi:DNA-binding phage protein
MDNATLVRLGLARWNLADNLHNEVAMRRLLEAAFEDGDAAVIREAFAAVVRARGLLCSPGASG